jgi:hypothetical protein
MTGVTKKIVHVSDRDILDPYHGSDDCEAIFTLELMAEVFDSIGEPAKSKDAKEKFTEELRDVAMIRLSGPLPSFYEGLSSREIDKLRKTLASLEQQLVAPSKRYPRPPAFPESWPVELTSWLDEQESAISKGAKRKVDRLYFALDILSAFERCFGEKPTTTVGGPAFKSIMSFFDRTRPVVQLLTFLQTKNGRQEERKDVANFLLAEIFSTPTDEQVRDYILRYLKAKEPSPKTYGQERKKTGF